MIPVTARRPPAGGSRPYNPFLHTMSIRVETSPSGRGIGVGRSAAVVLAVLWMAAPLRAQAVNEFPIGNTALPQGVTLGPDGNLWFVELIGKIGRMTPSGDVTEFPTPTVGSSPQDIATGPDGALWFTEHGEQQDRSHHDRRRRSPSSRSRPPTSSPYGIAAGPDGALWFTESDANKIGRITTAGVVTEFPIPTANVRPALRSPPGPDGNLWFTEHGKNKIGRITPAGVFTEFPVPTATAFPEGITAGADGNLWFTEISGHKVGRITHRRHDHRVPACPSPSPRLPHRAGPDGNLWFTEFDDNRIGRITTAGVITEFLIPTSACGALRHRCRARRRPLVHRVPDRPRSASSSSAGRLRPRSTTSIRSAARPCRRASRAGRTATSGSPS